MKERLFEFNAVPLFFCLVNDAILFAKRLFYTVKNIAGPSGDVVIMAYFIPPKGALDDAVVPKKQLFDFQRLHLDSGTIHRLCIHTSRPL